MPDAIPDVETMFHRRGAYARFKQLLERHGQLQRWYDYENQARREALEAWCRDNAIEVDGQG